MIYRYDRNMWLIDQKTWCVHITKYILTAIVFILDETTQAQYQHSQEIWEETKEGLSIKEEDVKAEHWQGRYVTNSGCPVSS